jgi:hypothetical protein
MGANTPGTTSRADTIRERSASSLTLEPNASDWYEVPVEAKEFPLRCSNRSFRAGQVAV